MCGLVNWWMKGHRLEWMLLMIVIMGSQLGMLSTLGWVQVRIDTQQPINTLPQEFVSYTIDASNLDKSYPFESEKLITLAKYLAPALLRVGGTNGDELYYNLSSSVTQQVPNAGYTKVMQASHFDQLMQFAEKCGSKVSFGLNGGPGPRNQISNGNWNATNALSLLEYAVSKEYTNLYAVELGNEPNLFAINFDGFHVDGPQLGKDFTQLRSLLNNNPQLSHLHLIGPDLAYQVPIVGDILPQYLHQFLSHGGIESVFAVTWHWYPMQSEKCPFTQIDPFKATPWLSMQPITLNLVDEWIEDIQHTVDNTSSADHHPAVWMGECASASCSGEDHVSNAFCGGFWWLDNLGRCAQKNIHLVARQSLLGGIYGLLNETTMNPQPDYWSTILWKRLMGEKVFQTQTSDDHIFGYAHEAGPESESSLCVLLLNTHIQSEKIEIMDHSSGQPIAAHIRYDYVLQPYNGDPTSSDLLLNGNRIILESSNFTLPPLHPKIVQDGNVSQIVLPPRTYGFYCFGM